MKVNLITLGCPKNLVDSEFLQGRLQSGGVQFIESTDGADAVIINTCGFIESAKEESIDTILAAVELKRQGKCSQVIVTGCLSERYGPELRQSIPELDGIYGNRDLQQVVQAIGRQLRLQHELLGERELLTPRHYAYMKISEGCEHPCTFCAIPAIRGGFRSRSIIELVHDAQRLSDRGVRELVLIAQDSTVYGQDLYGEKKLPELLQALAQVDGIVWIRLMYAYPYHVTDAMIEAVASLDNVCKYIDMPVQHVSDRMLKRMARRMNGEKQHRLIEKMRQAIPELVLRTSVIVGFPGETEEDFVRLYDYVTEGHFDRLGVFTYSREDGTPSASFPEQVPDSVKRERQDALIQAQEDVAEEKNRQLIGRTLRVLVDEFDASDGVFKARTQWDCPEIDNTVLLSASCRPGAFYDVQITAATAHDLSGAIVRKLASPGDEHAPLTIPVAVTK